MEVELNGILELKKEMLNWKLKMKIGLRRG